MNELKNRLKQIDGEITTFFHQYRFDKKHKTVSNNTFEYVFTKNDLFVIFKGSCHPYDFQGFINLIVGKGDYTYPALDNNGYALWRIARYKEKNDEFSEYKFESLYKVSFTNTLMEDVDKYLKEFLIDGIIPIPH